MTLRLALKELKMIEHLNIFQCIIIDRMKAKRRDLYDSIKDYKTLKEVEETIIKFIYWEEGIK